MSVMICETIVYLLVIVQNKKGELWNESWAHFVFNLEVFFQAVYCVNWFVLTFLLLKVLFLLPQSDLAYVRSLVFCLPKYLSIYIGPIFQIPSSRLSIFVPACYLYGLTPIVLSYVRHRLLFALSYSSRPKSLKGFSLGNSLWLG